jgi:hypothetical protein
MPGGPCWISTKPASGPSDLALVKPLALAQPRGYGSGHGGDPTTTHPYVSPFPYASARWVGPSRKAGRRVWRYRRPSIPLHHIASC